MENVKTSIPRHNKRVLARAEPQLILTVAEPIESSSKLCDSIAESLVNAHSRKNV
jgi:hypothetical protein